MRTRVMGPLSTGEMMVHSVYKKANRSGFALPEWLLVNLLTTRIVEKAKMVRVSEEKMRTVKSMRSKTMSDTRP